MPDQFLMYSIENSLMIISISINSQSCKGVIVIRLVLDYEELVKVALKEGVCEKEWVDGLVVEGVCVRDCRWPGFCEVGRVE
jgi:hypothetical protein